MAPRATERCARALAVAPQRAAVILRRGDKANTRLVHRFPGMELLSARLARPARRIRDQCTANLWVQRTRLLVVRRLHFRCLQCSTDLRPKEMGGSGVHKLECVNGHDVAVASEGHVHLLHTGRLSRKGAQSGDSDASIRARRAFFDLGGYAEQIAAVASAVVEALPRSEGPLNILDAGCGEGRYLREVESLLQSQAVPVRHRPGLWGTDLSKLGVRYAAKRQPKAHFAVARSTRLPFANDAFDVVLSAFAPVHWAEFERVLRPSGSVVVVRGGSEHLMGLKEALYENARPQAEYLPSISEEGQRKGSHPPTHLRQGSIGAAHGEESTSVRVRTSEVFRGIAAAHLLKMTPFYWRATPSQQAAIMGAATDEAAAADQCDNEIRTVVDFRITTFPAARAERLASAERLSRTLGIKSKAFVR